MLSLLFLYILTHRIFLFSHGQTLEHTSLANSRGLSSPRDLAADLTTLDLHLSFLLQYVDDLLLCSPSKELSQQHTIKLLNFLAKKGYWFSPEKVQLSCPQVTYLGIILSPNNGPLPPGEKKMYNLHSCPNHQTGTPLFPWPCRLFPHLDLQL